jgi:hypothetical protein
MVQITLTKDIRMAMPSGQPVPFVIVPQTVALSVNFGTLVVAAGMRMTTTIRMIMFIEVPTELNLAI